MGAHVGKLAGISVGRGVDGVGSGVGTDVGLRMVLVGLVVSLNDGGAAGLADG